MHEGRCWSNRGAAHSAHLSTGDGALVKRLWQQVSSIQHSVCHSCQSSDRDLSTLSSLVRQTDQGTHTELRGHICMSMHTDVYSTTSRLVRADDNWLAGWQESDCLGHELVLPLLSLSLSLHLSPLSLPPSLPSLSGAWLFLRIGPAVNMHYVSPGVLLLLCVEDYKLYFWMFSCCT